MSWNRERERERECVCVCVCVCVKSSDVSPKSFMWPAYNIWCKGGKSVLIMKETWWKSSLNFVRNAPMIYVNFIIIVISFCEKTGGFTSYRPCMLCHWRPTHSLKFKFPTTISNNNTTYKLGVAVLPFNVESHMTYHNTYSKSNHLLLKFKNVKQWSAGCRSLYLPLYFILELKYHYELTSEIWYEDYNDFCTKYCL